MNIIDRANEWLDRLSSEERSDLKTAGIISLIGVPLIVIATGLLLPYTLPALAALSFTIGALCALAYLAVVFMQTVAPIILNHYKSEPNVAPIASTAPANGLVSGARLAKEHATALTSDSSQLLQNDRPSTTYR
jgi:hypothetical protein